MMGTKLVQSVNYYTLGLTDTAMDDLDKYALEQAKVEIDHTRSWPTKILAFYTAINTAVVTALIAARATYPMLQGNGTRISLTIAIGFLLIWALWLLGRNHLSYLRYRNMQIRFQKANEAELTKRFPIPREWLAEHEICLTTRAQGWLFYAYLILLVTAAAVTGIWSE